MKTFPLFPDALIEMAFHLRPDNGRLYVAFDRFFRADLLSDVAKNAAKNTYNGCAYTYIIRNCAVQM